MSSRFDLETGEVWESFDVLWRRLHLLTVRVRELESKLETIERAEPNSSYERQAQACGASNSI